MSEVRGRITDFYEGKGVFLTGASGYLGVVLLETLLRCCPGIQRIYILLREKKGVQPERRKAEIFKKSIFSKLKETDPEIFNKVQVIPGDSSLPNLGMSADDLFTLIHEVSIVFHVAASTNFKKPLRYSLSHNARAVDYVINFCKKLKKIDAFVLTSTVFSNCNRKEIEEEIYRLPFPAQRFLDTLNHGSDDDLNYLVSQCEPKWPNNYTFSKCLSENIVFEKASGIPTAIIRPSVVVCCWKGVCPGYIQEGSGIVDLGLVVGKGFARVIPANPDIHLDLIPVDVIANAHVVAAYKMASERSSPLVVNCVSGDSTCITLRNFSDSLLKLSSKYPVPKSFQEPNVTFHKNFILYWLFSAFEHYVPAYLFDMALRITGRKPRLFRLYRFYDIAMSAIQYFLTHEWNFHNQNFKSLAQQLHPDDKEMFYTDLKGCGIESMTEVLPKGAPFYQWDIDERNISERKRIMRVRTMTITFIKCIVLACLFFLAYVIVYIARNTIVI